MRYYRVGRIEHQVYEPDDSFKDNLQTNWREGQIGDWVLADDNCIIQVLRRGDMKRAKGKNKITSYIGTCTGTFCIMPSTKMDTSKRDNIYSFSGRMPEDIFDSREDLTAAETAFVQFVVAGLGIQQAYLQAFPTSNPGYANMKAGQLIKTTRVQTAMKEELKPVLEELGVDETYVVGSIKKEADTADKPDVRLKALFKLADIMDLEDKNRTQVTQISGAVFQGFSDEALEAAERPKEITNVRKR